MNIPVEEAVEDGYAVCITAVVVGPNVVITVAGTPIVGVVDVVAASVLATVVGAIVGDGGLLWAGVVAVTEDGTNVVLAVIVVEVLNNIAGIVDVFSRIVSCCWPSELLLSCSLKCKTKTVATQLAIIIVRTNTTAIMQGRLLFLE